MTEPTTSTPLEETENAAPVEAVSTKDRRWIRPIGLAILLVGLGAATLLLALDGTWLVAEVEGVSSSIGRDAVLRDGASTYEVGLLNWPLVAAPALGIAGILAGWVGIRERANLGTSRVVTACAHALAAYAAFLLALVGIRFAGFTLARTLDPGPAWLSLGIAPLVFLILGLVGLGVVVAVFPRLASPAPQLHARLRRRVGMIAACAAAALLVFPLVPLAQSVRQAGYYYDELTFAALVDASTNPLQPTASALYWTHVALWLSLALSLLLWAVLRNYPATTPVAWKNRAAPLSLGLMLPILGVALSTVWTYSALSAANDVAKPTFGFVLPLTSLALLAGIVALAATWFRLRGGAILAGADAE